MYEAPTKTSKISAVYLTLIRFCRSECRGTDSAILLLYAAFSQIFVPVARAQLDAGLQPHVAASQIITIASLSHFISDVPIVNTAPGRIQSDPRSPAMLQFIGGGQSRAGTYKFSTLFAVRGNAPTTIEMRVSEIDVSKYGTRDLSVRENAVYLLLLKSDRNGQYIPEESSLPFIPLGQTIDVGPPRGEVLKEEALDSVIKLLIASLRDADVRASSLYSLRGIQNKQIVTAVMPLVDDSNLETQRNALLCLASNKVVSVIPKIGALAGKAGAQSLGGFSAMLRYYDTTDAIPYLGALLNDPGSRFTRLNAAMTLAQLYDDSCIPHWVRALRDPEDPLVPFIAYGALHRLIPALGPPKDRAYFLAHKEAQIAPIEAWWSQQQSKKDRPAIDQIAKP